MKSGRGHRESYMDKIRKRFQNKCGFTLAELLLTVVIIGILGAVGAAAVIRTQKSMEQLKFDRVAESLYSVAQNQLSQRSLMYGGNTAAIMPIAASGESLNAMYAVNGRNLYIVKNDSALASRILPTGSVSADVRDGSWIVEYEPESYTVYSVFYSDLSPEELLADYRDARMNAELRSDAETRSAVSGGRIGYYSGELPGRIEKRVGRLDLSFEIENGEKLSVRVKCESGDVSLFEKKNVELTVAVQGKTSGNTMTRTLSIAVNDFEPKRIALDSLKDGESFCEQMCRPGSLVWLRDTQNDFSRNNGFLYPGEEIKVSVTARSADHSFFDAEASGEANSLFADSSDAGTSGVYTAHIACARHLQNLNTETSGFRAELFGEGTVVDAVQASDINFGGSAQFRKKDADGRFCDWFELYPNRTFIPIRNDALRSYAGHYCTIRHLTVDCTGDAGLFASFGGGSLTQIVLEDPVVRGTGNVGGLAGTLTGAATVDSCRVYMDERVGEEKDAGRKTAADMDWMKSTGGYAGGLIGSAYGGLTVTNSFAATVVEGAGKAGGLVGNALGALTVSGSYADCYVSAETLGGLAGSCGAGSSFTSCYSAGFALYPKAGDPVKVKTAAGFVPSPATVGNCYSVFCFGDPMTAEEGRPAAVSGVTTYSLTDGGTMTNAYDGLDGEELFNMVKQGKLAGFAEMSTSLDRITDANPYGLLGGGLEHLAMTTWEYPALPLPRYNDFYCAPETPVDLYRVVIKNAAGAASLEGPEHFGVAELRESGDKRVISARANTRFALSQAFVGWFDSAAIADLQSDPVEWAFAIDRCGVGADGWYVNAENGRIASVHGKDALRVPNPKGTNETIELSETAAAEKKVYAVYREAQTYEVRIWYTRFLAERFTDNVPTAEKYLNGGSIFQPIIYMVNPIVERGGNGVHTFQLSEVQGYELVSDDALNRAYNGLSGRIGHVASFWGFEEENGIYGAFSSEEMATLRGLGGDAEHGYTITVRIDKPCAYGVLYDAPLVEFDALFHFDRTEADADYYDKESLNENAAEIQEKLRGLGYYGEAVSAYTATVHMAYPENVTVWPDISSLKIDGFKLDHADNTVVKAERRNGVTVKSKPLEAYFTREQYKLGFKLDNGVYKSDKNAQDGESVVEQKSVFYNEPLAAYFPGVEAGVVQRKGYTLLGWSIYPAKLYGTEEGEEKAVYVSMDDLKSGSVKMPPYDAVAKAMWEPDKNAKVRLEIYVQDVLDDKNKTGGRNYPLYNTYYIDDENTNVSDCLKANDDALLRDIYEKSRELSGANPKAAKVAVPIEDNDRSYLNRADGTMKCPQLTLDTGVAESSLKGDGKPATYELDELGDGAAVFRLFYKRNKITYEFRETVDSDPFLTIDGLYEAPLSHYGYEWPKLTESSQNQSQYWTAYAGTAGSAGKISDAKLSFLDSFYYDSWITGNAKHEATLLFVRHKTGGTYSVSFYLEKISDNPRDDELRALVNQSTGANDFSDRMDSAVTDGGKSRFLAEPDFVEKFDSSKPPVWFRIDGDSTAVTFTPNDKYNGYTMGHFITDLKDAKHTWLGVLKIWDFNANLYKNVFLSWNEVKSRPYESGGIANESRDAIRFAPTLEMYNSRNVYRVYFNNVNYGGGTQFVDAYLYGAPIDRLPNITRENEANYRPDGLGSEYHFVGWNTRSDGMGEWWESDGGSTGTPFAGTSPYAGSEWLEGGAVVARFSGEGTGKPVTMPANNLSVFAVWRTGEVTVNCYSMLRRENETIIGFVEKDGAGRYAYTAPAVIKTFPGGRISEPLAALRSGFGLIEYAGNTNVLKIYDKYYHFAGWYQATDAEIENGVEPKTLTQRFNESDYVAMHGSNTLNLVARWEQIAGLRGYTVECLLHDDITSITPRETLTLTNRDCGYPDAQVGKPLTVNAPAGDGAHPVKALEGYTSREAYQSVESLDDEHSTFTFSYYPGKLWRYAIDYCVNIGGVDMIFMRETGLTPSVNFAKSPPELKGYTRLDSNEPVGLTENEPTAVFHYRFADGAVLPASDPLTWEADVNASKLLTINTYDGMLNCLNGDLAIETTATLNGGGTTVEWYSTANGANPVKPALGAYTLHVNVALKRGGSVVGTIYSGDGATVYVNGALTLRSGEKTVSADLINDRLNGDVTALAEELRPTNVTKPFLGFYDGAGSGAKLVIDGAGALQSPVAEGTELYARFGD